MKVRTRTLERLAGALWLAVGVMLLYRGVGMLRVQSQASTPALILVSAAGLGVGWVKGTYVLARGARRNRRRILALAQPRVWNVFTGTMALLILGMMGLGFSLRAAATAGWMGWITVGAVYVGIGAGLAVSSLAYFRRLPPRIDTRSERGPARSPGGSPPVGVLLVQLGTPDAPTPGAVRRYLREFLSDPHVVELPRWLWLPVLHLLVLPRRVSRVAKLYASIWMEDGSPLAVHSRQAASALAERLGERFRVELGMRYGRPSLDAALDRFAQAGCERLVVLPLFPQACRATTVTVQTEVARLLDRRREAPALQMVAPFYVHAAYVEALVARIEEKLSGRQVDLHLFSFHSVPEETIAKGDPYLSQCTATAWALAQRLGLEREQWEMVFQSQFGDEPWLGPQLADVLAARAQSHRRVLVALPGFAADCLETLEEVDLRARQTFVQAGGEELLVVPALNASPRWIDALASLVRDTAGVRPGVVAEGGLEPPTPGL